MQENIFTISEITGAIKELLEDSFGDVSISGEISNFVQHSSGHRYFTLKDEGAAISAVMWRSSPLNFEPKDGMKVIASGSVSVYPQRGSYQIVVRAMKPEGEGDLFLAFEALKKKLSEKGYFASERKRPIPKLPMKIGVLTSPTGAAVRDIMSTLARRQPLAKIYFRPTTVQGDGASEDIVRAIAELNNYELDVIISGRGGGSLEDLWCFNEEIVADAIYNSKVPIISAVGHETDFTISDFVADIRAATPTAAAELASQTTIFDIKEYFQLSNINLNKYIKRELDKKKDLVSQLVDNKSQRKLISLINQKRQRIDDLRNVSIKDIKNLVSNYKSKINVASFSKDIKHKIAENKIKFENLKSLLNTLHPLKPLSRNFAIIKADGKIVPMNESLSKHKNITIVRQEEEVKATIKSINQQTLFG